MAVPSYDELLARVGVEKSEMEQTVQDSHLTKFSFKLDRWELLAKSLELPKSEIEKIKEQGDAEERRDKMLECWKQRCGSRATYETLTRALLRINRTDLAEILISLCQSLRDTNTPISTDQARPSLEPTFTPPPSPQDAPILPTMPPTSVLTAMSVQPAVDIVPTPQELEEEFYQLVKFVEETLEQNDIGLNTITGRFRMLPQSTRRQYQTDKNYGKQGGEFWSLQR